MKLEVLSPLLKTLPLVLGGVTSPGLPAHQGVLSLASLFEFTAFQG